MYLIKKWTEFSDRKLKKKLMYNTVEALVKNLAIEESGELLSDFWGLVRCDEVAVKGNYCTSQRDNNK